MHIYAKVHVHLKKVQFSKGIKMHTQASGDTSISCVSLTGQKFGSILLMLSLDKELLER